MLMLLALKEPEIVPPASIVRLPVATAAPVPAFTFPPA
jgi:hypothetical protein